ncbi:OsmC family protein [Rubrimonas cliftonensis]|uniref:Osmotically inducible protein OsmC n=1 Tax=Rubrimonas cliftonensis TaxID=89524 RepID=A0A1H3YJ58_9RHOB|nr:OsmC family protein [Rubrimonas cliftonensis]SEA11074.1 osmotically inducible protein OsmC [Rubrimonas cliftonensis]
MKRTASAVWSGDLPKGAGAISTPSGVLKDANYSFKTRFEEGVTGTNPEELIAAAHAGCFSMALSHALSQAGHTPEKITTVATLTLEQVPGGFSIPAIHLKTDAHVPGVSQANFDRIAKDAKEGCPVSRVLNAEITLEAKLTA